MNKKLLAVFASIIFLFILFNGCLSTENEKMNNVRIKGSKDYFSSIREALSKSNNGDTIIVGKGTYKENITIYKTISLIGEDKKNTIIDANSKNDGLHITSDFVKISGFTIRNSGKNSYPNYDAGIDIRSNNNYISNNIFENSRYGIYIRKGSNNTIVDNFFSNNDYGIYSDGSYYNMLKNINISNNIFSENLEKGIYMSYSFNSSIKNNEIFENVYGLHMQHCDNNFLTKNYFDKNEKGLFFCCGADDNIIYNNIFENNSEYNAKSNCINQFYYFGIGNFWDDYNGTDENNDGIGDIPFEVYHNEKIDISNQDKFPLIEKPKLSVF